MLFACYRWEGEGVDEKGIEVATGKVRVQIDPKFYRPTEVVRQPIHVSYASMLHGTALPKDFLLGDASKAERILGWKPKTRFTVSVWSALMAVIPDMPLSTLGAGARDGCC